MTRRPRGTTISAVAAHAGVSPATVSRVMNDHFFGAPEIADRVRASARELDYSPSHLARSLAIGQTNAVGFLVPDLANPTFQAVLAGLSKVAAEDGYRVLVADSAESTEDEPLLATEIRRRCDALILCAPRMSEDDLERTTDALGPVVLLNRWSPVVSTPIVAVDSRSGFESLVRHLYSLGHRHVVYIQGPDGVANDNRLRGLDDFQRATGDLSLSSLPGGATTVSGLSAVDAVLKSGATAALAFNDLVAMGLIHGLGERGIQVPEAISVTGFDDIPFARFMSPALTTASVPHDELGALAWRRMRSLINRQTPEHNILLQPRLEVRKSTAPAPR